jgi:ParB/RepB/Spo0J family partition protein
MNKLQTVSKKPAKADAAELPLDQIFPNAANFRKHFDEAALAELAASIKAHGVLQPLIVRPSFKKKGSYELVAGERRWRAAKIAGLKGVPASIREMSDVEALEVMIIENDQRVDLSPIARAEGYRKLLDNGRSIDELAAKIGRTRNTIYGILRLLRMPPSGRVALESGELPATTAQLVAKIPGEAARERACIEVLGGEEPLSFRRARELVRRNYMIELKLAPFSVNDKTLAKKEACVVCPKMTGNNPSEFPDSRGDVCTDPDCYRAKVKAHAERIAKQASPPAATTPGPSGPAPACLPMAVAERVSNMDAVAVLALPEKTVGQLKGKLSELRALHADHRERAALDSLLEEYEAVLDGA